MIENKQVNLWRGNQEPPTLYHIWLKDESQLLRYDEESKDWVVFLDSKEIGKIISDFMSNLNVLLSGSINGHPISENPVLNASDLLVNQDGNYYKSTNNLREVAKIFDDLMTTQIL